MSFRWIEGEEIFSDWKLRWQELETDAGNATPFQTWEWLNTWWKHFGRGKPLALAAFEGENLVAWFPVSLQSGSWRALRPLGVGCSDYLHPLIRKGYESVSAEFLGELLSRKDVDLVDLHQVREDFFPLAEATRLRQARCLILDLPASYAEFRASLGKSLRYDVRRLEKPPFSSGEGRIVTNTDLEVFFDLHARRWRKRFQPGAFPPRLRAFHRELAQTSSLVAIRTLVVGATPIGCIYTMSLGDTTYFYQAGMSPESSAMSPGTLLVAHSIRNAIEQGHTRFDFLRGDEPYKRRWKPQNELSNFRLISPSPTLRGRLGAAWNRKAFAIETRGRSWVEGKSLFGA